MNEEIILSGNDRAWIEEPIVEYLSTPWEVLLGGRISKLIPLDVRIGSEGSYIRYSLDGLVGFRDVIASASLDRISELLCELADIASKHPVLFKRGISAFSPERIFYDYEEKTWRFLLLPTEGENDSIVLQPGQVLSKRGPSELWRHILETIAVVNPEAAGAVRAALEYTSRPPFSLRELKETFKPVVPEIECDSEPIAEPEAETGLEAESEAENEPEPEVEPEAEDEPEPEVEPEAEDEPEPEVELEPELQFQPWENARESVDTTPSPKEEPASEKTIASPVVPVRTETMDLEEYARRMGEKNEDISGTTVLAEAPQPKMDTAWDVPHVTRKKNGEIAYADRNRFVIGSKPGLSDFLIRDNPSIAREHVAIEKKNGRYVLVNLTSGNDVILKGETIARFVSKEISVGDEFSVAGEQFQFCR